MSERLFGALGGLFAVGLAFGLTMVPGGWFIAAGSIALLGWILGGYVRHLNKLADHDELTGMQNRRPFERALEREWERAVRLKRPLSLVFIDVDNFGALNKRYGHLVGDDALRLICREIRQSIRRTDLVARWGGDEFVLLLPETDLPNAVVIAERIQTVVSQCVIRDRDRTVAVTVSIGAASIPGDARTPLELLREAIGTQAITKAGKHNFEVVS